MEITTKTEPKTSGLLFTRDEVLSDFRLAWLSRYISELGRKEVLTGKAKFGIFGDGKETAQLAYAKALKPGDWRSGYYRDQTMMLALGLTTPVELFAQLYGVHDISLNPSTGGRSMVNHFATRNVNPDGSWKDLTHAVNSSADISPTAGQMPRLLGLAYASKLFRENPELKKYKNLSREGGEIAFGTIGDASTAQGHFFETMNAAAVLQVPLSLAIWDDGYGVSVPTNKQVANGNISDILKGFEQKNSQKGILLYHMKGWDYPTMLKTFKEGVKQCREKHVPVVFHVTELTQPSGHSTSGSHERYKSKERLQWEKDMDSLKMFEQWIREKELANKAELEKIKKSAYQEVEKAKEKAWKAFISPIHANKKQLIDLASSLKDEAKEEIKEKITGLIGELKSNINPVRKDILSTARQIYQYLRKQKVKSARETMLVNFIGILSKQNQEAYNDKLVIDNKRGSMQVKEVPMKYPSKPNMVNGRELLRDNFNALFHKYPKLVTFGEDSGKLGDVHKGLEGLQAIHGENRITDTGIREATIIGQGIGLALRGLRPIAEIQYLDYLLFALQTLSDDVASTFYRTAGGQTVPLIVRTRGHRLEGIWHSGSPMGMVINALRGMHVCVPRNMAQAAGFYNTLLEGDDPALVIEPLNAYGVKVPLPENLGEFKIPLGTPEIMEEGNDITLVTYGSCVRIAREASKKAKGLGISIELIDVQTLLPFDKGHMIARSLAKTNKVLFLDEDVPGGATAYMMQKVLNEQEGYYHLDAAPVTLSAKEHRPAYSTDGDYFSKPNVDDVVETIYDIMHGHQPVKYP